MRTGPKNPFSNFWAKGRKLTEALYRVKGGLKCVLRGFTRSDIHFWPENDQKTTFYQFFEFSEYFEDQLSKSRFFSLTMFYRVMWRKKGKTRPVLTIKFCLVSGTKNRFSLGPLFFSCLLNLYVQVYLLSTFLFQERNNPLVRPGTDGRTVRQSRDLFFHHFKYSFTFIS